MSVTCAATSVVPDRATLEETALKDVSVPNAELFTDNVEAVSAAGNDDEIPLPVVAAVRVVLKADCKVDVLIEEPFVDIIMVVRFLWH